MQNRPRPVQNTSLKDIDFAYYVRHYWDLFWRCKWFLLVAGPLVTGAWIGYILTFGRVSPELPATAVVGIENASNMSAVHDVGGVSDNYSDLIRSRLFLREVVENLSLRFRLSKLKRVEVLDSVLIDTTAALGKYIFKVTDDRDPTYSIYYWNSQLGFRDKLIKSGRLVILDTLSLPGIFLDFSPVFLKSPKEFSFYVTTERIAVDAILRHMNIAKVGYRATQLPITITGRDYSLVTKTANEIADLFVQRNLSFRKRKTTEVLRVLKKQLETAEIELAKSKGELRSFRSANPTVGLGQTAQAALNDLTQVESGATQIKSNISDARRLAAAFSSAAANERPLVANEIAAFLHQAGVTSSQVIQNELVRLSAERAQTIQMYAANHPARIKIEKKVDNAAVKAFSMLQEYIDDADGRAGKAESTISGLTSRIQSLPAKEMRLVELQRNHAVNSNIHATILNRFNEARIADAVEVADVYVLDYAVVPVPPPDIVNLLMRLAIGLFLGLAAAFGPVILMDILDKTARSEEELKKLTPLLPLESIPVIPVSPDLKTRSISRNANPVSKTRIREIDKRLITADYAPNFINEIFRSLRTKLLYLLHDIDHKRIVVTSLNMGEGKSTIVANMAITMAQQNLKTLLIDGDLRRGVLHNSFVASKTPGLADQVFSDAPITAESVIALAQPTHVPNLLLVTTGPNIPNPQELLGGTRFAEFVHTASTVFDMVILDTPPLAVATDAIVVANHFSKYIVVAKAGKTNIVDLRKKMEEFPTVEEKTAGIVLNYAPVSKRVKYYKYSNYSY